MISHEVDHFDDFVFAGVFSPLVQEPGYLLVDELSDRSVSVSRLSLNARG
jgi:hypothetical protein